MDLYIPKTLKIGFQTRSDTFTGKLGYITYFDDKGVHRKATSWESWRDKSIPTIEIENKPISGFVFNKGIQRDRYWGSGRSVIRVYDSRDFEFEISVDNLIGLLMHSDVSKREIQEECVFAWAGKELVLLPVNSVEYQESVAFTNKQATSVSAKELILGATYAQKKSKDSLIYLGYHVFYENEHLSKRSDYNNYGGLLNYKPRYDYMGYAQVSKEKQHIFYNTTTNRVDKYKVSVLSTVINSEPNADYPNLVHNFLNSPKGSKIIGIKTIPYTLEELSALTRCQLFSATGNILNSYELNFEYYNTYYDQSKLLSAYQVSELNNARAYTMTTLNSVPKVITFFSHEYHNQPFMNISASQSYIDTRNQIIKELFNLNFGRLFYLLENGTEFETNTIYNYNNN